jgi:hypothetical protein
MKAKEQHWQEINELRARIAALETELSNVGSDFVKNFCPYKPGQRVIVDGCNAIVLAIRFSADNHSNNLASIQVEYQTKDWVKHKTKNTDFIRESKRIQPVAD